MDRSIACASCGEPTGAPERCPVCGAVGSYRPRAIPGPCVAGRYHLVDLVAEGGMGRVYRALQLPLERAVAIKFVDARRRDRDAIVARFFVEAQAASRVRHPNVVTVLDFGTTTEEQGSVPFLVMELLGGSSLAALLERREPVPIAHAAEIVAQLLDGLAAVHAAGITHRDVKPDNVILEPVCGGRIAVKLLDFGVARIGDDHALTPCGAQVGTLSYMAPEAAEGEDAGPRADLYAAGLILFELLTGERPFEAGAGEIARTGIAELVSRHGRAAAPDPRVIAPARAIPAAMARVCMRALDPHPAQRFASAEDFARDLRAAAEEAGPARSRTRDALLEAIAREAARPAGAFALVHGPDGVGRTTALARLAERIEARGGLALRVAAPTAPAGEVALSALARVIATLAGDRGDDDAPSVAPEVRAGLAQVRAPDAPLCDPRALRAALLWAMERARASSGGGRLAVLLDDVDLWDPLSRRVLAGVAEEGPRAGIALVVASRSPDLIEGVASFELVPIDRAGAARELERRAAGALPRGTGPAVVPLQIELLARWRHAGGAPDAPLSLAELVEARLDALSFVERETLRALAVLGSASIPALAEVADLPDGIEGALIPLEAAGLVEVRGAELSIAHAIVARAAIARAGSDRLAAMHARAALLADAAGAPLELRVFHELRGAPTSTTLPLADRVARLRESRGDFGGALAVLDEAADAAVRLSPADDLAAAAHQSFAPRIERLRSTIPPAFRAA